MLHFVSLLLWWSAAAAVWLLVLNRVYFWLPSGHGKPVLVLGLLIALELAASFGARHWQGVVAPLVVLSTTALAWFANVRRHQHLRSSLPVESNHPNGAEKRWSPLTTMELVAHRYELQLKKLPVPRLRVAHLSDLHVGPRLPRGYYESAFSLVASYNPDLLVLTGDLVKHSVHLELLRAVLRTAHLPHLGGYAVLGNRDYGAPDAVRELLTEIGFLVVAGRCHALDLASPHDVTICGDDRPFGPPPPPLPQGTRLALSHTPDNIDGLRGVVDVVFCGHLHGGQFRIPGLGALIAPSKYGPKFDRGHFCVEGTHLFVSSGVGGEHPRLWCEPDVFIVDLLGDTEHPEGMGFAAPRAPFAAPDGSR